MIIIILHLLWKDLLQCIYCEDARDGECRDCDESFIHYYIYLLFLLIQCCTCCYILSVFTLRVLVSYVNSHNKDIIVELDSLLLLQSYCKLVEVSIWWWFWCLRTSQHFGQQWSPILAPVMNVQTVIVINLAWSLSLSVDKNLTLLLTHKTTRGRAFIFDVLLATRPFAWYHNLYLDLWNLRYFWKT